MMRNLFVVPLVVGILMCNFSTGLAATEGQPNVIAASCILSTDETYAHEICERLKHEAKKLTEMAGLDYFDSGKRKDVPGVPVLPEGVVSDSTISLMFFVRGTVGRNVGASVRILAAVHTLASEAELEFSTPVRIVLWEQSAVATGRADKITKAMGDHMAGKLSDFYGWLAEQSGKQQ